MRRFLASPLIGSEGDPGHNGTRGERGGEGGGSLEESAGSILAPVNHGEPGIPGVPFHTI